MADEIDLGAALDAVVASIATGFPAIRAVVAEDENRKELTLPAIIVQMSEIEPDLDNDAQTGQFPCLVHMEARIVLGHRTPTVRREVCKAAGALAAHIHKSRLGVSWGGATIIAVEPDEFAPMAEQFDIWRIEWVHSADIGPSYFVDDGVTPTTVMTSWDPKIGPDHEHEYIPEVAP